MTGFRLKTGGHINRDKPISFTFDGKAISGFEGDVATSALLASGDRIFGRGFKYHRPRGVMSAGAEEGGALFQMYDGSARIANVKGPLIEIHNQLALSGQNGLPSVRFDVMAINGLFKSFLTAGFYYKTFMGPFSNTKFWMLCERFIRKAAGMGAATRDADPDNLISLMAFAIFLSLAQVLLASLRLLKRLKLASAFGLWNKIFKLAAGIYPQMKHLTLLGYKRWSIAFWQLAAC